MEYKRAREIVHEMVVSHARLVLSEYHNRRKAERRAMQIADDLIPNLMKWLQDHPPPFSASNVSVPIPERADPKLEEIQAQGEEHLQEIHQAATSAGLTLTTPIVSAPLNLDDMIAAAVNRTPDANGLIPGEPGIEGPQDTPPPQPPLGGLTATEYTRESSEAALPTSEASQPPAQRRTVYDMANAPRDGTVVMLEYSNSGGTFVEPGKWSSTFGRQFWETPDGETLGSDDLFQGWDNVKQEDREEFGL